MSSTPRIPRAILELRLPNQILDALLNEARALGLDTDKLVEALPRFYALGFYDGALAALRGFSASKPDGVER